MDKEKRTKASTKAKTKYNKKTYSRTTISLKHDEMDKLNLHCQKFGYSKNGFIVKAIEEKIKRDEEQQGNEIGCKDKND